jgi:hypothetical protein
MDRELPSPAARTDMLEAEEMLDRMRPVCHACHNGFAREKVGPLIDESGGVHEREEGWCFQQRTATLLLAPGFNLRQLCRPYSDQERGCMHQGGYEEDYHGIPIDKD